MISPLEPAREPGPVTAEAPSNIAFIKYWGARDLVGGDEGPVPFNRSLSMTLDACRSICSASPLPHGASDEIVWLEDPSAARLADPAAAPPAFAARTRRHLDRLREWSLGTSAPYRGRFRIVTGNTFPSAAGIASSASGFTALTLAVTAGMGFDLPPRTLSALSRSSGSGSAARSAWGGYVEWPGGDGNSAAQILDEDAWELCDVVAVVETGAKKVSSRDGHRLGPSSPYFAPRLAALEGRLERVRTALLDRDFAALGPAVEEEGIDLHLIAMSSKPPVYYWSPGTLEVLTAVRAMRAEGVAAYATMDAGANVHVICQPEDEPTVAERIGALSSVERVLRDRTGGPPTWRPGADAGGLARTRAGGAQDRRRPPQGDRVRGRATGRGPASRMPNARPPARPQAASTKDAAGAAATGRFEVTLVKLGGSLITDKAKPRTVAEEHVRRLAAEVAAGWSGSSSRFPSRQGLVIGHGSGSFGHPEARAAGLAGGAGGRRLSDPEDAAPGSFRVGIARTQSAALDLHRMVVQSLVDAGVPAYSQPASGFLVAADGHPRGVPPEPMAAALRRGLVPVTMGDVVLDRERVASIASTEEVFAFLVGALGRRGIDVKRVVWLGVTAGVLDAQGRLIPRIERSNIEAAASSAGRSAAVDVTGGMGHRLAIAWELARLGVGSLIADGRRPGLLESVLRHPAREPEAAGTLVAPVG